jgi:hypothetical protein
VLHAEAVEISREILRNSTLSEDLVIGAQAFVVANQGEGALQILDSLSKQRVRPRLVRAGIELIDSLPPEVDAAQRLAIRNRLIRHRGVVENPVDDG